MGFLKRLLVEEVVHDEDYVLQDEFNEELEQTAQAELTEVNTHTIIKDIYAQNELLNMEKSIFKVEELINSLPKEMVTETKKTSVLATLKVFGLTVAELIADATKRINTLKCISEKICEKCAATVEIKSATIEEYKMEIARLEKEIDELQSETNASVVIIECEIDRIEKVTNFIEGGTGL